MGKVRRVRKQGRRRRARSSVPSPGLSLREVKNGICAKETLLVVTIPLPQVGENNVSVRVNKIYMTFASVSPSQVQFAIKGDSTAEQAYFSPVYISSVVSKSTQLIQRKSEGWFDPGMDNNIPVCWIKNLGANTVTYSIVALVSVSYSPSIPTYLSVSTDYEVDRISKRDGQVNTVLEELENMELALQDLTIGQDSAQCSGLLN